MVYSKFWSDLLRGKLNRSPRLLGTLLLLIISAIVVIQGIGRPLFFAEEAHKLFFLISFENIWNFLPGQHAPIAFFGHPGLHQFIMYLGNLIFGPSLWVTRAINLGIAVGSIFAIRSLVKTLFNSELIAVTTASIFALSPAFLYHSPLATQDIMAIGLLSLGLNFYFLRKHKISVATLLLAVMTLESSIAGPISILIYELASKLRHRKNNASIQTFPYIYLIPLIFIFLFFISEYLYTGRFGNSITAYKFADNIIGLDYLYDLNRIIDAYKQAFSYIDINFPHQFLLIISPLSIILLFINRKSDEFQRIILIVSVSIQYLFFYIFINELPIDRDFFFVGLTTLSIILYTINLLPYGKWFTLAIGIFLLNFTSSQTFSKSADHYVHFGSWRSDTKALKNVSKALDASGINITLANFMSQRIFAHKFYGYTSVERLITNDFSKVNTVIAFEPANYMPIEIKEALKSDFKLIDTFTSSIHGNFKHCSIYFRKN